MGANYSGFPANTPCDNTLIVDRIVSIYVTYDPLIEQLN